jgi:hypothetical protein
MMAAVATPSRTPGTVRSPGARKSTAKAKAEREACAGLAVAALRLLGRWQRVCSGHLSFTNGCACGFGASVDLGDLDDLIIDYLRRKFAAEPALASYIAVHDVPGGMKSLLRNLATDGVALPAAQARDLMAAIEASVASIEEQHRT